MRKNKRKPNKSAKPVKSSAAAPDQSKSTAMHAGKSTFGLTDKKRRTILKSTAAAGVLIGAGVLIQLYDSKSRDLHDLTSIGNGLPVVVQVHDPSCALCRRLKANTLEALDQMEGVQYRIADLTSSKGREMAAKYGAEKVTLLLFDGRGEHVGTVQGVTPVNELLSTFSRRFG